MTLWLVRRDLYGAFVGESTCIADSAQPGRGQADLILDAFAALHLAEGERLQPGDHRLWIDRHGDLVGYFDILESPYNPAHAR